MIDAPFDAAPLDFCQVRRVHVPFVCDRAPDLLLDARVVREAASLDSTVVSRVLFSDVE